jgi:predicted  nucleic acid-binding Zn-ribbon protein
MKEIMKNLFELQTLEFDDTIRPDTEERITQLRAKIPAPILAHYDRLGDQGKKGLAILRNQTCSGCHMRLPLAVVMNVRHATDVCLCDNCRRYLYLPEDTAMPAKPAPARSEAKAGRKSLALQTA